MSDEQLLDGPTPIHPADGDKRSLEAIQNFKGKYPKQIWALFFSEMWERFCFYGMRGMLTYFMVHELLMKADVAQLQYGATQAFVYAFTFIGGLFADKVLGFQRSLFWGGLLMIVGSVLLAIDPHGLFFVGIAFNIIGTGFFKPNISSMVGMLYKEGDSRTDAGFLLFYSGINIGAFIGGYLIAIGMGDSLFSDYIPAHLRWNFAFGAAAVAMSISLITFLVTKKSIGPIGLSPLRHLGFKKERLYQLAVYAGALAIVPLIILMVSTPRYTDYFMMVVGPFSLLYMGYEMTKNKTEENKKLIAALLFIFFSVVFWAIFEQAGGSLSLFAAEHVDKTLFGVVDLNPNFVNNSFNSLFVIAFAPLIGLLLIWMARKHFEPNSIIKFGIGFLFLGLAYYLYYACRFFADDLGKASMNVFVMAYFVVTLGELFLSPIGMSLMTKLSPYRMQGFMMGMWFLASAYGQYVAGLFGASISPKEDASAIEKLEVYTSGYKDFALYAIIAGVILIVISPLFKKLMGDVK
ncbi:MAG: peptide MFS transporter [Bacteroidota bacterium]